MDENKTLDIVKKAILMEYRGRALYKAVARESENEGIKELFNTLAKEEENHIEVLERQFQSVNKGGAFDAGELMEMSSSETTKVLNDKIVKGISAAGYEAAGIAAALEFEKKAVEFYSQRAEQAGSDEEGKVFNWLAEWEKEHMGMLAELDRQLMESIWHDNNFWPLD